MMKNAWTVMLWCNNYVGNICEQLSNASILKNEVYRSGSPCAHDALCWPVWAARCSGVHLLAVAMSMSAPACFTGGWEMIGFALFLHLYNQRCFVVKKNVRREKKRQMVFHGMVSESSLPINDALSLENIGNWWQNCKLYPVINVIKTMLLEPITHCCYLVL